MAEASDFKFGTQLGFTRAHHKITPRGKSWWPWATGASHNISRFLYNISATAAASDFKFGTQLGFANATTKPYSDEKWAWPWVREAPIYLGFFFNISAMAMLSS